MHIILTRYTPMSSDFACYSYKFLIWWDPWVYIHLMAGIVLELFLRDWKLSILLGVLWEVLETIMMTFFRSYVLFGGDNDAYESASDSYLGDILINTGGVVIALLFRHYIVYVPRLIVYAKDSVPLAIIGVIQMLLILLGSVFTLIIQNTLFPIPENTIKIDVAIIVIVVFQVAAFAYMYFWTIRTPAYYRIVWGQSVGGFPGKTFGAIAILLFIVAIPYFVKLPWTQVIAFSQVYIFAIFVISWSLSYRSSIKYRPSILFYGNERKNS